MSTEPEREIEKTLRDYARHRQDAGGTPPALHPVTRKLLQDEVSRQKTGERRTGGLGLLLASWPGFFLKGSVALAVLVVGAFLLAPFWRGNLKQQPTLLAKNNVAEEKLREVSKKEVPPALTPPPPATAAPSSIALRKQSDEVATKALQKDVAVSTPQPVERARSNPVAAPGAAPAPVYSVAPIVAPITPPTTVAPATPPVVATDTFAQPASRAATAAYDFEKLGPVTQQYARVNPTPNRAGRGGAGGGAANRQNIVLRSFRVEQNGGQIRVIDADGSIYTGTVTPGGNRAEASAATTAAAASALDQTKAKSDRDMANGVLKNPAAAFAATNAPVITGNMFRVRGTNLTLNQPVEFTGSFVANDQPPAVQPASGGGAASGGGRGGRGGAGGGIGGGGFASAGVIDSLAQTNVAGSMAGNLGPTVATNTAPSPLAGFRLQGEVVIGTNRVGINAVPTKP